MEMIDMNMVIASNISMSLEKNDKKQVELAAFLGVSRQVVNKMLNGIRTISADELRKIAEYLKVSMEELTTIPKNFEEMDVFHVFMGKVETVEAQQSLQDLDRLIELILFHSKVKENGANMIEEWTEF